MFLPCSSLKLPLGRLLVVVSVSWVGEALTLPSSRPARVQPTERTIGPCDIYGAAGTPCVAAHSVVRALYGGYAGSLYQVRRRSDNKTLAINVLTPGGYANAVTQDTFCHGSVCTIDAIFDQSSNENHLFVGVGGDVATGPGGRATPDMVCLVTVCSLELDFAMLLITQLHRRRSTPLGSPSR